VKTKFSEVLIVSTNNLLQVFVNLWLLKFLSNGLDESNFGKLQLVNVACTIVNFIIYGPLNAAVQRYYSVASENREYDKYIVAIKRISVLTVYFVFLFFFPPLFFYFFISVNLSLIEILVSLCYLVLAGQNIVFLGILTGGRNRVHVLVFQSADFMVKILMVYIFRLHLELHNVLLIFFIGSFCSFLIGYYYCFHEPVSISVDEGVDVWFSKLKAYALPFAKWGLLGWGQIFSERFFLKINSSIESVAHFSALFQIGYQSIVLIDNIITQVATPILYQMAGPGISGSRLISYCIAVLKLILVKLIFYSLVASLIIYNSEFIVNSLTGPIYLKYIDYMPLFAISAILFIIAQTATLIVVSQLETNLLFAPKVYTALIAIACNYVFSFYLGLLGTVFSGVIFSIFYFIWIAKLSMHKIYRLKSYEVN